MSSPSRFNVGLFGTGYVSGFHIAAFKRERRARIVGITDFDPVRAKANADRFGITVFPSLKTMAAKGYAIDNLRNPKQGRIH